MSQGWEWIVTGAVAIVVILWGPSKIPQFARALGRIKGRFRKVSRNSNLHITTKTLVKPVDTDVASSKKSVDDVLLTTAHVLGISAAGKTREQISIEISREVKLLAANRGT